MPPKIRELIAELERHGYVNRGGKGSHRNFVHPTGERLVLSGNPGADARKYQVKEVEEFIRRVTKK